MKGFAKRKYDKEHETELSEYDSYRAKLKKMLSSDEKITPKKWTAEKAKLEGRLQRAIPTMQEWLQSLHPQRLLSITVKCLP